MALSSRSAAGVSPERAAPGLWRRNHWHAIVKKSQEAVRLRGDDGEGFERPAVGFASAHQRPHLATVVGPRLASVTANDCLSALRNLAVDGEEGGGVLRPASRASSVETARWRGGHKAPRQ